MIAVLYAIICVGAVCTTEAVTEMPFGACVSIPGQHQAVEYAAKREGYLRSWKCEVGRRV